jgi:hypothetical protein
MDIRWLMKEKKQEATTRIVVFYIPFPFPYAGGGESGMMR